MDNKRIDIDTDIYVIRTLEQVLKIKFIIFEMYPHNLPISIGDMVLYKGRPHRVLSIPNEKTNSYNLYNSYTEIKDVSPTKVKIYTDNPLNTFRIFCDYDAEHEQIEFNDYMYIVLSKYDNEETGQETVSKFKLVQNTNTTYIFSQDKIPIYIKYLIFNSCPNLDRDKLIKMGFKNDNLQNEILDFGTIRSRNIQQENIRNDIDAINNKISQYKNEYKRLKSTKDKSLEEQAEELLYREEIKDLKERRAMLKEFLGQQDKTSKPVIPEDVVGGATTPRPSQQYYSNINQYNPTGYPLNQNIPGNVVYLPRQGYPYQNSYYSKQYNVPYNVSQNKAKDQKSKLSFYITIELELFPGTSANVFQKSVVKCQSTFERIRESWADIFGFEYRPAPMTEAYSYIAEPIKKDDNKNKTEKNKSELKSTTDKSTTDKSTTDKSKTRKNRSFK